MTPDADAVISITSGDDQSGPEGELLPLPLEVTVSDIDSGRPEPGVTVLFAAGMASPGPFPQMRSTDAMGRAAVSVAPSRGLNTAIVTLVNVGAPTAGFTMFGIVDGGTFDAGVADAGLIDGGLSERVYLVSCGCNSGAPGSLILLGLAFSARRLWRPRSSCARTRGEPTQGWSGR